MSNNTNSEQRPRRHCRDRETLSQQHSAPARSILQQPHVSAYGNASQPIPITVQPSPKPVHRTQSRISTHKPSTSATHSPSQIAPPTAQPLPPSQQEQVFCPMCALDVNDSGLICDRCSTWFHYRYLFITDKEFSTLSDSNDDWFCDYCKSILANRIRWGDLHGEEYIQTEINKVYKEIITWNKNIFMPPRGKAGTEFIKEITRLFSLFTNKTKWERLALPLIHIFLPLILQKPSKSSKARDHAKYLLARLDKWKAGDIKGILDECRAIQKRIVANKKHSALSNRKAFCRLMLAGKLKQALKFINNENDINGVHTINSRGGNG